MTFRLSARPLDLSPGRLPQLHEWSNSESIDGMKSSHALNLRQKSFEQIVAKCKEGVADLLFMTLEAEPANRIESKM
jgi:hypothetical protein